MKDTSREVFFKFYLPENEEEMRTFQQGPDYRMCLENIYNILREKVKYQDFPESSVSVFEEIKSMIGEELYK